MIFIGLSYLIIREIDLMNLHLSGMKNVIMCLLNLCIINQEDVIHKLYFSIIVLNQSLREKNLI